MARISFLLQGLEEYDDHYAAVTRLLDLPNIEQCIISVAFMNAAGANMTVDKLTQISDKVKLFVGIRNGVTSKQSIETFVSQGIFPFCVDTATQSFIFHPKVYLAQSDSSAVLVIGSANFTHGGLIKNIEASLIVDLDLNYEEDLAVSDKIIQNFIRLQNENPHNVFRVDNNTNLDEMVQQGILEDETFNTHRANTRARGIRNNTIQRPTMQIHTRRIPNMHRARAQGATAIHIPQTRATFMVLPNNQLAWKSGPLTRRDLNIPTEETTHATGSMLLKVGDPSQRIDQRHHFRDVIFASAAWRPDTNPRYRHIERCFVKFRIIIKDIDYGVHLLKLSHNTRTDTATYLQNNSMTQIHWGNEIKQLIAHEDLLDSVLNIFTPEDGSNIFTLVFDIE